MVQLGSEAMSADSSATWLLEQETRALLTRLASVQPFVLQEPHLPAAALSPAALSGIEQFLIAGRREVRRRAQAFLRWLRGPGGGGAGGGATAPFLGAPAELPERAVPVRPLLRGHHPAQRARTTASCSPGSTSRRPRRYSSRGVLRRATGHLLAPSRAGWCHPPGPDQASGRRGQPGRPDPDPARADDRLRHRLLARARGRAPGCGAACARRSRCGPGCASIRGRLRLRTAWDLWERWISEIVADFWSVSQDRDRLDARADRAGQPASGLRLPAVRRRPAPDAVGARPAQLRDRRPPVSGSAVAAAGWRPGGRCTRSPACGRSCRAIIAELPDHDPGAGLGARRTSPGAATRLVTRRGAPQPRAPT